MDNIYQNLQTPCFVLLENELHESVLGFRRALQNKFRKSIIGYSVKTNSLPYCLSVVRDLGCYAEVVSYNEFRLALQTGFVPGHIIYNGPMKSRETFLDALASDAVVNIETWREIEWLKALPQNRTYKVGIRLNIDISDVSPADENHEEDNSRFGFSAESDDFARAVEAVRSMRNIQLAGLHTHRTSGTRSVDFYKHTIAYAKEVIGKYRLHLEYWDLGGGYFGPMPNKPTYEEYARAFDDALGPDFSDLTIIVEPGNALVASAFDYVSKVIDVKQHGGKYYITTDATRNDIDPFFHKTDYFKSLFMQGASPAVNQQQIVAGSTCLEYDRLFTIPPRQQLLQEGDRIVFHRVGAYTMALTPLFIHYFPMVYVRKADNTFEVVREEWTEKEFIQNSKY